MIHPLTTPIIEVNDECTKARAVWWSLGVEGLSKFREKPMAIISLGMVPGTHVKEEGEWKILSGAWQRTTKNEYHKGCLQHGADKYKAAAYTGAGSEFSGEICLSEGRGKKGVAEPPGKDTWKRFPEETSTEWIYTNLK